MNIANLTNEELIEIAKEIPEFQEKIEAKLKEKQNAEMLQEEQNLADELRAKEKALNETADDIVFLENKVKDAYIRKDNIEYDIRAIKKKMENIHKKWIKLNPAKSAEQPEKINPKDVREAFDILAKVYGIYDSWINCFKRFDNLIHGRCKTSVPFAGASWTKTNVIEVLQNRNHGDLANKLK